MARFRQRRGYAKKRYGRTFRGKYSRGRGRSKRLSGYTVSRGGVRL